MNKLNVAIEDTIDKAMKSINTHEQEDLPTDDMVFEPQENYGVDITGENEYNSYIVERKKETPCNRVFFTVLTHVFRFRLSL